MSKYINAEKLYKYLEQVNECYPRYADNIVDNAVSNVIDGIKTFITSRQQEQPEKSKKDCNVCPHCVDRKDQYGWHFKGCFGGPYNGKFIAEIDECPLKQEQPEGELEKEINRFWDSCIKHNNERGGNVIWSNKLEVEVLARHFNELGNRALEEAARHVYESWMGGTMDDVRRDMVELGKVLNARKK